MLHTDKPAFAAIMLKTWRFYGKTADPETAADWYDILESYPLDAVASAFRRHLTDTERGQYLPKPADVIRFLDGAQADDGRPGGDEAWGMLLRLVRDERETGVLSDEIREAWSACGPILDAGDEIGARRCFLEVYSRMVTESRRSRKFARWTVTLGVDPTLRLKRLKEAVEARRIDSEHARSLLPGPSAVSLDQVAGLLEGPTASEGDAKMAERLRGLAAMLRSSMTDDREQRRRERAAALAAETAEKARIADLVSKYQSGEEAA